MPKALYNRPSYRTLTAILLVALGLSTSPAFGQQTGVLVIRVTGATGGEPIAGALVVAGDEERLTGRDGRVVLPLEAISVRVHVSAPGWASREVDVAGRQAATDPIEVALQPQRIDAPRIDVLLDRFAVVGSSQAVGRIHGSASYLGPEDLARSKTLYDDVHALLRQIPGINVQEEDAYGLRPNIGIRGTGSERSSKVTLMEDGVLIAPAPYAAPSAYYAPVAGRMSAIEVRKGSSQVKYGPHTIGGAVNFVSTPIPERGRWFGRLEGGEDGTGKLWAGVGDATDHVGWLAETYQIQTDGFKQLDGGGDTGFEIHDYRFKLRLNTDRQRPVYQELEVKAGYYDETSNETYLGLTEEDFRSRPLRRYPASAADVMRADQNQVQLRHGILFEDLDLTTVVYRNTFSRNWFKLQDVLGIGIGDVLSDPAAHPEALAILRGGTSQADALMLRANNRSYRSSGVQSVLGARTALGLSFHEIEIGLRYHADEEDRFQHEDGYRMVAGELERTSAGAPGSQSNRISDASAWAFFVQDRIDIGRWSLTPGLRYETIDFTRTDYAGDDPNRTSPTSVRENKVRALIPGLGAGFEAADGVGIFAGVHRGFGPPGPGAYDATEAERSVNYEIGMRLDSSVMAAEIIGFYNDYENILGRATLATGDDAGDGDLFNGGRARVVGAEVALRAEPRLDPGSRLSFPTRLSYTYTSAEFETSFESEFEPWGTVEAGDQIPYIPTHQLHAAAGVAWPGFSIEIVADRVSAARTRAGRGPIPDAEGTDAYTVWGLSGEYDLSPRSSVFFGVRNLTDAEYVVSRRPAGARPGLPRTLLAGIRIGS